MHTLSPSSFADRLSFLRRFLLQRGYWMLGGFTLLTLLFTPMVSSPPAQSPAHLWPTRILFAVGTLVWLATFLAAIHASFIPRERPSFIASLTFFLLLGFELLMLAAAAQIP